MELIVVVIEVAVHALVILIELAVVAVELLIWVVWLGVEAFRAWRQRRARRPVERPKLWRRRRRGESSKSGKPSSANE